MTRPLFTLLLLITLITAKAQTKDSVPPNVGNIEIKEQVDSSIIKNTFTAVEFEAQFDGGNDKFYNYLYNKIKFPKNSPYEGSVSIQFLVSEDGRIMDAKILQSKASDAINKIILRAFFESPRWHSAIQNGRVVRQSFNVDLVFNNTGPKTN